MYNIKVKVGDGKVHSVEHQQLVSICFQRPYFTLLFSSITFSHTCSHSASHNQIVEISVSAFGSFVSVFSN